MAKTHEKYNEWIREEYHQAAEQERHKINGKVSLETIKDLVLRTAEQYTDQHVCGYKCNTCGDVLNNDDEEFWGHLQLSHKDQFEECRDWETPFMLEEHYEFIFSPVEERQEGAFNRNLLCDFYSIGDLYALLYIEDFCTDAQRKLVQDLVGAYLNLSYQFENRETSISTEEEYRHKKWELFGSFSVKEGPWFQEMISTVSLEEQIRDAAGRTSASHADTSTKGHEPEY